MLICCLLSEAAFADEGRQSSGQERMMEARACRYYQLPLPGMLMQVRGNRRDNIHYESGIPDEMCVCFGSSCRHEICRTC